MGWASLVWNAWWSLPKAISQAEDYWIFTLLGEDLQISQTDGQTQPPPHLFPTSVPIIIPRLQLSQSIKSWHAQRIEIVHGPSGTNKLTPMGEQFSTNFSSCDFAVPGSPSNNRLMSPLLVNPSGNLKIEQFVNYYRQVLLQCGHSSRLWGHSLEDTVY